MKAPSLSVETTPHSGGSHRREVRRLVGLSVAGVAVAWVIVGVIVMARAHNDLVAGRRDLVRARQLSSLADIAGGRPLAALRAAEVEFARAHGRVRSPLLFPARFLPVVGRQVRSVIALSAAGRTVAEVGRDAVQEIDRAIESPHRTGLRRLALLSQLQELATRSADRLNHIDLGPERALVGSLANARSTLQDGLADLRAKLATAEAATTALHDLLRGPRTYLVFGANNSEMRAGSGMFLTLALLRAKDGQLSLGSLSPTYPVATSHGTVAVGGDMAARWGWAGVTNEWTNLMLSPRFDVSAPLAAKMWIASGHPAVDGVLALDPVALKAVLQATGPVSMGRQRIGADQIEEELLYRQYLRFANSQVERRKEEMGAIARSAFTALEAGRWDLTKLGPALGQAARGRHLMLWSQGARENDLWRAAGLGGTIQRDSLLVAALNRGGNKLDRFCKIDATLSVTTSASRTDAVLRLLLRNTVPSAQPPYIAGPYPGLGLKPGEYLGVIAVTLPGAAGDVRVEGIPRLGVAGSDGPTLVVGGQVKIPRGRSLVVVIRFSFLGSHGSMTVEASARRPPIDWQYGSLRWQDEAPRLVVW